MMEDDFTKVCKNKKISSEEFMEWVMNDLSIALESNFDDVYEEEFGDREEENEDE